MAAGDVEVYTAPASSPTEIDTALTGNGITSSDNITSYVKGALVYFVVIKAA